MSDCSAGDGQDPGTPRILVAEDNAVNRKLAVTLVRKWGFDPVVAENGQEVLATVDREHIDLILMDVQMPVMDGLEATRVIRAQEEHTGGHLPIVALTAHAYASDRARCMDAGMDDFLTKPVDQQALRESIVRLLATAPRQLLDRETALARVDGDVELLHELAALFLETCPTWLADLRRGVDESDPERLRRAAHTLKGSAATFGAATVVEAALCVEKIGASNDLAEAPPAVGRLEARVAALRRELESLEKEDRS